MAFDDPFRAGFGAVRRSKRFLLFAAAATAVVSLPLALWAARAVHDTGSRRPDAIEVARTLDPDFFADVRAANPSFDADAAALVYASIAMWFFLRPFLWGGYAGIAASRRRLSFSKFVREGGAVYWKYLRISAVGVLLLLAVAVATKPLLELLAEFARNAPDEHLHRYRTWVAQGIAFGAACLVGTVLDYARVGVRMRRRPGVLAEIGRSALFVLQHPFRTTGFYAVGLLLELAVIAPLVHLIRIADGAYLGTAAVVLLLGQLLVALREATRLFHLAGAWRIREAEEGSAGLRPAELDGGDLLGERLPWHVP